MTGVPICWINKHDARKRRVADGIVVHELWRGLGGRLALVVDIEAGAVWPHVDVHEPGPEEVYVVDGVFNDGVRDYPAGTFIHNPTGSSHVPQSKSGCVLFVFYPDG